MSVGSNGESMITTVNEFSDWQWRCSDGLTEVWSFINSFILETYIAPLQETTTQRRSQPSHGQKRRIIWYPSNRNAYIIIWFRWWIQVK